MRSSRCVSPHPTLVYHSFNSCILVWLCCAHCFKDPLPGRSPKPPAPALQRNLTNTFQSSPYSSRPCAQMITGPSIT
jgi:hypothetical protein